MARLWREGKRIEQENDGNRFLARLRKSSLRFSLEGVMHTGEVVGEIYKSQAPVAPWVLGSRPGWPRERTWKKKMRAGLNVDFHGGPFSTQW